LDDPKVKLIIGDGIEYVKKCRDKFDLIVLDVSDPVPGGPAERILSHEFYKNVSTCLSDDGVMLTHCGSLIFQAEKAKLIVDELGRIFDKITMHVALIPEFELTEFGFLVCRNNAMEPFDTDLEKIINELFAAEPRLLTPEVFKSTKVLSPYIQQLTGVTNR
jgi:spermidine synthase